MSSSISVFSPVAKFAPSSVEFQSPFDAKRFIDDIIKDIVNKAIGYETPQDNSACDTKTLKQTRKMSLIKEVECKLSEEKNQDSKDTTLQASQRVNRPFSGFSLQGRIVLIDGYISSGSHGDVFKASWDVRSDTVVKVNKLFKEFKKNDYYLRVLQNEANRLKSLCELDASDRYSIARYKGSGMIDKYRFCLVEDLYSSDLYKLLLKTQNIGFSLSLVSTIGRQLLTTLDFFKSPAVNVIHCDLKPQNILADTSKKFRARIADFGSCKTSPQQNADGQYLVTRYYRAPEIILGLPFDHSLDLWSLGAILFELHTAQPLFQAKNNTELFQMFFELMGPIPGDLVRQVPNWQTSYHIIDKSADTYIHKVCYRPRKQNLKMFFEKELSSEKRTKSFNAFHAKYHTDENYELLKDLLLSIFKWKKEDRLEPLALLSHPFFKKIDEIAQTVLD